MHSHVFAYLCLLFLVDWGWEEEFRGLQYFHFLMIQKNIVHLSCKSQDQKLYIVNNITIMETTEAHQINMQLVH